MTDENERAKLPARSRSDLNAIAAEHGIDEPEKLPNKDAVVEAILEAAPPTERSFRIREDADGDDVEDAVSRVSVGADPRISIAAGDTYTTDDPRLADRLAAHPELEEVNQ